MTDVAAQLRNEIATINKVFAAFGVEAQTKPVITMVAGHSFVAYGLRISATQRISDVQRLLPELSERLSALRRQRTPVRLREMPLALEVTHPTPRPLDWKGAVLRVGAGRMVAGRNYSASPVSDCVLDLEQRPHLLVAGTTGSGKSTVLRMLLSSLTYSTAPDTLRLVMIDLKNEDLRPFAALPHVDTAAWLPGDAQQVVAGVHSELQRRVRAGSGTWARLVLVVDELAQIDQTSLDLLSSILAIGRSKRVHVIAATQHPAQRLIGDKANYSVRLVGQVMDAQTAALATGRKQSGAELLPGAGSFLLVDGARLERLQAYNLTAETATHLVNSIRDKWGSTPAQLPVVEPLQVEVEPVEDEITRIAGLIERLWRQGASKSAMCREALSRPYAGSYAAKIDRAIRLLESTTTTTENGRRMGAEGRDMGVGSSSRTAAPILRMGGR